MWFIDLCSELCVVYCFMLRTVYVGYWYMPRTVGVVYWFMLRTVCVVYWFMPKLCGLLLYAQNCGCGLLLYVQNIWVWFTAWCCFLSCFACISPLSQDLMKRKKIFNKFNITYLRLDSLWFHFHQHSVFIRGSPHQHIWLQFHRQFNHLMLIIGSPHQHIIHAVLYVV